MDSSGDSNLTLTATRSNIPLFAFAAHVFAHIATLAQAMPKVPIFGCAAIQARIGWPAPWEKLALIGTMRAGMFWSQQGHKVFWSVIQLIKIAVVYMLIRVQHAPQLLSDYQTVFVNIIITAGHWMSWIPDHPVAAFHDDTAAPSCRVLSHLSFIRRLAAFVCRVIASARTKHPTDNGAWLSHDGSAACSALVCCFHIFIIPRTARYINT